MLAVTIYWLVTIGLFLLASQVYLRRPPAPLWPSLFLMYVALFLWALGDAVTGTDLALGPAYWPWIIVLYTGVIAVPPLAWLFALGFAELQGCHYRWANAFARYTPAVIGCVFWCVMLTNPWHGAFIGLVPGSRNEYMWLWHWNANVGYVFIVGAILVLAHLRWHLRHSRRRSQATLILVAIVVPLMLNMMFKWVFTDMRFDLTMVGLAGSCVLFFAGIYRDHLFALSPVTLRHIVEHDPDGILLLNRDTRLLLANPAAHALIGPDVLEAGEDVLANLSEVLYTQGDPPSPVDGEALRAALTQSPQLREGHVYRFGPDASRWLRIEATPMPGRRRSAVTLNLRLRDISEFKNATEAAGGYAAAIEAILSSITEGILVFDAGGAVIYVNDRFAEMWEVSRDDIALATAQGALSHVAARMVDPDDFLDAAHAYRPFNTEDLQLRDGRIFAQRSGPLVRDGAVKGRVWSFRDVTEAREAERAVRNSAERLRLHVDRTPLGAMAFDENLHVTDWNNAAERIFGYTAEEAIGRNVFDLIIIPEWQQHRALALEALRIGKTRTQRTNENVTKTGARIECEWFNTTLLDDAGNVVGVASMVQDITERRLAQGALQQSREQYQALVESAPIGILACDLEGAIQAANRALGHMLGAPEGVIRNDVNLLTFPPLQEAGASAIIQHCIDTGETRFGEITYTSLHGRCVDMRLHVAPLRNADGELHGVQCLVEDISERKQAEAALLHSQKLESLGVLAGGIAHDFNNLLVGVMGNAGLALTEIPASSPASEYLRGIEAAADRASELTRQMLAYAGKGSFDVRPLDLNEEVADLLPLLEVSISKNVRVEFLRDAELPSVLADPAQLQQVVMNLVTNGSDAIGDKDGALRVRTGTSTLSRTDDPSFRISPPAPGEYGYIQVTDSGCGMDAATLDRIFDPFFTTKFTGRGLGLAAVLGIIRGLGGALTVESEVGNGTSFTVWLPIAEGMQVADLPPMEPGGEAHGDGTVLIIEDDASVAAVAKDALERAGYAVVIAEDGEAGLAAFDANMAVITAVLLDLTMPRLSGKETLQALRERDLEIPVVLSTGYSEEEATQQFADLRYTGFVQKPYRLTQLVDAISNAITARVHAATLR